MRDGNGLKNTYLPTTGFDHELPGQVRSWLGLQGADDNALVQRITRHNLECKEIQVVKAAAQRIQTQKQEPSPGLWKILENILDRRATGKEGSLLTWEAKLARFPHLPMVEDRQGKGLPLGMSTEISLKAERVDGWDESFDCVERGAWDGCVLSHMPPERERQKPRP